MRDGNDESEGVVDEGANERDELEDPGSRKLVQKCTLGADHSRVFLGMLRIAWRTPRSPKTSSAERMKCEISQLSWGIPKELC